VGSDIFIRDRLKRNGPVYQQRHESSAASNRGHFSVRIRPTGGIKWIRELVYDSFVIIAIRGVNWRVTGFGRRRRALWGCAGDYKA
jgi:hypothetical protein